SDKNNQIFIANFYNNFGEVYKHKGDYDSAMVWYKKSLEVYTTIKVLLIVLALISFFIAIIKTSKDELRFFDFLAGIYCGHFSLSWSGNKNLF
ncbi:MAG: tetratricopeptide repeat protein, partial [Exilibacterium sp.]